MRTASRLATAELAHLATTRVEVGHAGGWSLRVVPRNSLQHTRDVATGRLRLQLVHEEARISLLTGCHASQGQKELYDGERIRLICCWGAVRRALDGRAPLPCVPWVREHERFWVHLPQIGASGRMILGVAGPD